MIKVGDLVDIASPGEGVIDSGKVVQIKGDPKKAHTGVYIKSPKEYHPRWYLAYQTSKRIKSNLAGKKQNHDK